MKKIATMVIASSLFLGLVSGCGTKYNYEETPLNAVVTECKQGDFHPDATYIATANSYLSQNDYGMYSMYMELAQSNGKYDYVVTVTVNDKSYTVIRDEEVSSGTEISITKVEKYDETNKLIETSYE